MLTKTNNNVRINNFRCSDILIKPEGASTLFLFSERLADVFPLYQYLLS